MMNITRALSISVSCLSLTAGSVFAYSFSGEYLSAPPPSILSTHEHTPQIRKSPHPQGVASLLLVDRGLNALLGNVPNDSISDEQVKKTRGVAGSTLLVDGNFQNQLSTVILGLDPRIQVKQGFLSHLDASVRHWHDNSAGIPRQARNDNSFLTASVCFITDTGACSGNSFGSGANTEDGGHGAPGGGSGNGGTGDDGKDPDYDLDNAERCKKEGYTLKTCSSVQDAVNHCPYDTSFFEKCVCKSDLVTCTKPQYGVGDSCGGKYASCETDNPRACREDGYTNTCASGQKLRKDRRCQYDSSFGICCTESCATNTALTCTGANAGDDGCGYTCKQCCVTSCPSGYDYTESQLTGTNGNGWVKDGTDYCDHCTKGRLYKRKAATCPSTSNKTCGCGGADQCKSGNNTYYSSCNCCSSCSGSTSSSGMKYYNSCYNQCTGQTLYTERSCDNSCEKSNSYSCGSDYDAEKYTNECGNTCYRCKYCSCKSTSYSDTCPANRPYKSGYTYDSCGYKCGPQCYDSKKYVEFTYDGCYSALDYGSYSCFFAKRFVRYEYIRYDGASRWENGDWSDCPYKPKPGGTKCLDALVNEGDNCDISSDVNICCAFCLAHPEGRPHRYFTAYDNF